MSRWLMLPTNTEPFVIDLGTDPGETLPLLVEFATVGGHFDVVSLPLDIDLWVDDEGLLRELPLNHNASRLAGKVLVGPVVVAASDREGATVGLSDRQLAVVSHMLGIGVAEAFTLDGARTVLAAANQLESAP